jgi:hypothetical protein
MLEAVTERIAAVEAYRNALAAAGDDTAARALAGYLAADVTVETNYGRAAGIGEVIELLREPRTAGILAAGPVWSAPAAGRDSTGGDTVTVTATLPPEAPAGGLELAFTFAGGKISRVEQQVLPAAPPRPSRLRLTTEIKNAVNGALDNETPVLIAYTTPDGEIHVSYRGTVQAYSRDQLALWAREPGGGLPRNIVTRPRVTLFYRDPATRTSYTFYGRARIDDSAAVRTAIFQNSHPRERQMDFRRAGVAIIVDLDKIEGWSPSGRLLMLRRPAP